MAWTACSDAQPDSDMSGNVTLYEVYDGTTVYLTGRFNDTWMQVLPYGEPTHWALWNQAVDPTAEPELWHAVATDGDPNPPAMFTLYEIFYDGAEAPGLTAWFMNHWILPTEIEIVVTHWKLPTLSAAP